jgi:hypothetical protein
MITDRINSNLDKVFNIDDPIYKSIICDKDGTISGTIGKPTDIDIGATASEIEYLRRLSIDLKKQLFINQASGEFLKYQLEEFFGSYRQENETDAAWVARTIANVFQQKVSRAAIIFVLRPYSSRDPEIEIILEETAFADFSFADVYVRAEVEYMGETVFVLPAIAENYDSYYTIKIKLYDTLYEDIEVIIDILNNILAAGISFTIQILNS